MRRHRRKQHETKYAYPQRGALTPHNYPVRDIDPDPDVDGGGDVEDMWMNHGFFSGRDFCNTNYQPLPPKKEIDPAKKLMLEKLMVSHYIETIPEDCKKKVIFVLQGDGVYERRVNKLGTFTTRIAEATIPGLKTDMEEGWELNVPKIPTSLLGTIVSFFRSIYSKYSSEVFFQLFYDTKEEEYSIHCPKQQVGGASVKYTNDEVFEDKDKILVFEIHSHGNMGAFFSGTDDRDEKADRFYGVIGNISQFFPDIKLRLSVGGRTSEIEIEDIFDFEDDMYHIENFPKDWVDNIEENKVQIPKHFQSPHGYFQKYVGGNVQDDLEAKFISEDFLMDQSAFVRDERDTGYFLQEGDKLWRIENGQKVWYEENGETYEVEDDVEFYESDVIETMDRKACPIVEDRNPLNFRGKRF